MGVNEKILALANRFGLYTRGQYLAALEEKGQIAEYARELEAAVNGMSDPKRAIVVMGDYARVQDVVLLHGQQIIISPRAKYAAVSNIICKGGA